MPGRFALIFILSWLLTTAAGAQDETCQMIVERALHAVSEHCGDLERNSLCYGSGRVEANFADDPEHARFDAVGARASLIELDRVQTYGLDADARDWGVVAFNLQAHRPDTQSGPGVIMLLAGAAELTHDLDPAGIRELGAPLSTATLAPVTLYQQPSEIAEVVGQLEPESITLVDAISGDGAWLRVVNDGNLAWAQSDGLARLNAMDALTPLDAGDPFALGSFRFGSSTALPQCAAAEPFLVIQAPADSAISLKINGADIQLDSMISLQVAHQSALSLTVHRGSLSTTSGDRVAAGSSIIGISGVERDNAIVAWSGALPVSAAEMARGQRALAALNMLLRANGWDEYDARLPYPDVVHTVVGGDSLFSIARQYDVRVADIISANGHSQPYRLYRGMKVLIPNPGSGFGGFGDLIAAEQEAG